MLLINLCELILSSLYIYYMFEQDFAYMDYANACSMSVCVCVYACVYVWAYCVCVCVFEAFTLSY